jgi:hypothetical protein
MSKVKSTAVKRPNHSTSQAEHRTMSLAPIIGCTWQPPPAAPEALREVCRLEQSCKLLQVAATVGQAKQERAA